MTRHLVKDLLEIIKNRDERLNVLGEQNSALRNENEDLHAAVTARMRAAQNYREQVNDLTSKLFAQESLLASANKQIALQQEIITLLKRGTPIPANNTEVLSLNGWEVSRATVDAVVAMHDPKRSEKIAAIMYVRSLTNAGPVDCKVFVEKHFPHLKGPPTAPGGWQ